ncbi:hypothetical protein [Thalassospira sp. TSL5-1]|uniref:hypothetical protein n=1 Tax=Thalassospira sp. TSL5-1 TaxID=1544451 RepID=UPI00093BDBD8|nr:hypothetical protein [Thalassospira sp. TSL5-1]OKH89929.1 hypothetical protein LF95_08580 [Thalassospira sp. TSL5-1]
MSITRYQTYAGTIQPGELFTITRAGRSVTCFEASAALEIVIDDGSSSAFFAGVSLDFDYEFKRIQLLNPNDTPVTFQIATAMGRVNDNRLTASGILRVADPDTGESFAALKGNGDVNNTYWYRFSRSAFEETGYQSNFKAPKHKVGASFASRINVDAVPFVMLDPASNTNGVIIRTVTGANAAGDACAVFVGPDAPSSWNDATKRKILQFYNNYTVAYNYCDPIYLPAGDGVYFIGSGSNSGSLQLTWDYL